MVAAVITQKTRCREIAETDLDAVADLLTHGFVGRSRDYWMQGLRRPTGRWEGLPASSRRHSAANISRARSGRALPT